MGRPKKVIERGQEAAGEPQANENVSVDVMEPETKKEPKKAVLEPLAAGQAYFETPDGRIFLGDAKKDRMWIEDLVIDKNGKTKAGWVNQKR